MHILVTGASGFVGKALVSALLAQTDARITAVMRSPVRIPQGWPPVGNRLKVCAYTTLDTTPVDQVIHLAAVAHHTEKFSARELYAANVELSEQMAKHALMTGASHFILVSSAYVHGVHAKACIHDASPLRLDNPYALTKLQAELRLKALLKGTTLTLSILRPAPVYAADAPGSFQTLFEASPPLRWLLLANARAERAFLYRDNLIASIVRLCTGGAQAWGETYLLADNEPMSMRHIISLLSETENFARLPRWSLFMGMSLMGKRTLFHSIFSPFRLDTRKAQAQGLTQGYVPAEQAFKMVKKTLRQRGKPFAVRK